MRILKEQKKRGDFFLNGRTSVRLNRDMYANKKYARII
jgi:hypothetical protein